MEIDIEYRSTTAQRFLGKTPKIIQPLQGRRVNPVAPQQRFAKLVDEWRDGTAHLSNIEKIVMHPAYQKIIGMGPSAVPLILQELKRAPGHWFWALHAITGYDAAAPGDNIHSATQKWLQWGKSKQLIDSEQ